MRTLPWIRGIAKTLCLLGAAGVLLAAAGCGGPERAPRQPVTGVDRPAEKRPANPHDEAEDRTEEPRPISMNRAEVAPEPARGPSGS